MTSIMSTGLSGLQTATQRFEASAQRVASDPNADLSAEIVEQKLAAAQFSATIGVIKAADKMMKSLLDIVV